MRFFNTIDEKGRFLGFRVTNEPAGQEDSNVWSYLFAREKRKESGEIMGLELCLWKKNVESSDSSSGEDMKNGVSARKCIECDGTEEYAQSKDWKCYVR